MTIDWQALRNEAKSAMAKAYAPYSNFPVGAAALTTTGVIISGCNVENASYGLGLCAECSLVSALKMQQAGELLAFTCCDKNGNLLMPCGRCRQLLFEHAAEGMVLETPSGIKPITDVLPDAFGPKDLDR
jgi:cytidine deaminase